MTILRGGLAKAWQLKRRALGRDMVLFWIPRPQYAWLG